MKKQSEYCYTIKDNRIMVYKNGKKTYNISYINGVVWCSCIGFGYHKTCKHYKTAEKNGMLNKIMTQPKIVPKIEKKISIMETARINSLKAGAKIFNWDNEKLKFLIDNVNKYFGTILMNPDLTIEQLKTKGAKYGY